MSKLDEALIVLRQDMENPESQSAYYDLFLNTTFFVPTMVSESPQDQGAEVTEDQPTPLVMECEGNHYLMIFDSPERVTAWAKEEVVFVEVPGHVLAQTSESPLHWALNVDTDYAKPFIPAEIAWLKSVVQQCNAAAEKDEQ